GEIWAPRHLVARALRRALAASGATITNRERDILGLLRLGHTNRQIAQALFISHDTVKWHFRKIFHKIGVYCPGRDGQRSGSKLNH
ncbi:MAG: response regulator transcription factor, partial [Nevskiales bacterium]